MTNETPDTGELPPNEHWKHMQNDNCPECAAAAKRLAIFGVVLGMATGVAAVLVYSRTFGRG